MDATSASLIGKMLIAMPSIGDQRFDRAVILICAHSDEYAMGLVLNKPMPDLNVTELLEQLSIDQDIILPERPVLDGGPVGTDRGFVLHGTDYYSDGATIDIADEIYMTATRDVLEALAQGGAPDQFVLTLGYAGWGPGQLEHELASNAWLVAGPDIPVIFGDMSQDKWSRSLLSLGINPANLTSKGGSA